MPLKTEIRANIINVLDQYLPRPSALSMSDPIPYKLCAMEKE